MLRMIFLDFEKKVKIEQPQKEIDGIRIKILMSAFLNGKFFFHPSPKKRSVELCAQYHFIPNIGFRCVTLIPDLAHY